MKHSTARFPIHRRFFLWPGLLLPAVLCLGCSGPAPLTVDKPLHLEDHLDAATIVGSEVPDDIAAAVQWRFDEPQPDWKPLVPVVSSIKPVQTTRTEEGLRLNLTEANRGPGPDLHGGIYIDLPDWKREDWAYVLVRARTSENIDHIDLGFNLRETAGKVRSERTPLRFYGDYADVIDDGSVQTYLLRADRSLDGWEGPWTALGINVGADELSSIEILSVSVIPKEAIYSDAPIGVKTVGRNEAYRRILYTHTPVRIEYRVRVPEAGRLDVGLGVLRDDAPVTFRITVGSERGEAETVLEEVYAEQERWAQRTVDLADLAGQTVNLALEADAEREGTVALWAAPTLTGARAAEKPNVIFYIIDGGAADQMSVYGYNRRTTPNLERLAREGAIFERAYSNATWTKPSTMSFMTSLQHSVLGGYKNESDPLPDQAVTMAQHLHRAGYQTAVFISNDYAGRMSSLDRGVDFLREDGVESYSASSRELHGDFWNWREAYPAEPYWAHFQTTDVHRPYHPVAPFAGLFVTPEQHDTFYEWDRQLEAAGRRGYSGIYSEAYEKTGISRVAFFNAQRGLYDESMAHNDYQIGQLVERLKTRGEWERTLLIVAADHSARPAGGGFDLGVLDSLPPVWGPMFRSGVTRIPLIVVWPGRIAPGQRFSHPVSMIDMLPTILDLADLPMPEVMQGQSLAPLLLGEEGWEPRPVILDEFNVDRGTNELSGVIEVIDGRWGASLLIDPSGDEADISSMGFHGTSGIPGIPRLQLYDLWNDPYCLHSLHDERPDLVEKYTEFLEAQWEAHQSLAQRFTRAGQMPLTAEQLRTLRALGYIQ